MNGSLNHVRLGKSPSLVYAGGSLVSPTVRFFNSYVAVTGDKYRKNEENVEKLHREKKKERKLPILDICNCNMSVIRSKEISFYYHRFKCISFRCTPLLNEKRAFFVWSRNFLSFILF